MSDSKPPPPPRKRNLREELRSWLDELTERLFPAPQPEPVRLPVRRY